MNIIDVRCPDKPMQRSPSALVELESRGGYLAQMKRNGFRGLIIIDHEISAISRHKKPLPISNSIFNICSELDLPNGTVIDGEWTGRRHSDPTEAFYPITILYWRYDWIGNKRELERWQLTNDIFVPAYHPDSYIRQIESSFNGYAAMFERSKRDPTVEGVVLKHIDSQLIGRRDKSADNPRWIKVRYKSGSDGEQICH